MKVVFIDQTQISTRSHRSCQTNLTNVSNLTSLAVKYDSTLSFDFCPVVGCDARVECHHHLNFTLITLSLIGTSCLDGQPRREYLKCLMCVSSEKPGDLCSGSLSFKVLSLEAACSCSHLFAAGGIHAGRRGPKPSMFEQQVVFQSYCSL